MQKHEVMLSKFCASREQSSFITYWPNFISGIALSLAINPCYWLLSLMMLVICILQFWLRVGIPGGLLRGFE